MVRFAREKLRSSVKRSASSSERVPSDENAWRGADRAPRRHRRPPRRLPAEMTIADLRPSIMCAVLALLAGPVAAQPTESVWRADSNLRPEAVCPAWKLVD